MAATQEQQDIRREIEHSVAQFEDATVRGSAAGTTALCRVDALLLPPSQPRVEGR